MKLEIKDESREEKDNLRKEGNYKGARPRLMATGWVRVRKGEVPKGKKI